MKNMRAMTRDDVTEEFSLAMSGQPREYALGRSTGTIKTYAIEANVGDTAEHALKRVSALAKSADLKFAQLQDESLAVIHSDDQTLVVDVLDSRFWLVHTTAKADFAKSILRGAVWADRDLDWCWLPKALVAEIGKAGEVAWFRSDFSSDELTPGHGQRARRLRVQLEGDRAYELLDVISGNPDYRHAASLTAVAIRTSQRGFGHLEEIADYKGRFVGHGDSFELHVGLVSQVIRSYAQIVRDLEQTYALKWSVGDGGGANLEGQVITLRFKKQIEDFDRFLSGLFSCREPFRLWGVPKRISDSAAIVDAVDLHVGSVLRMDVLADGLRVYLSDDNCGNSVTRLLANLQHRYDATIESPVRTN
jgi:hypothetical protein